MHTVHILYVLKKLKKYPIKVCIGRIFSFTDKKQKEPFVIPTIKKKLNNSKKKIIFENINHFRDFLNTYDIGSIFNKMCCKRMSQCMWANFRVNFCC